MENTQFKVMIEDHTNTDTYDGDVLTYIDTLDVKLFNCASGYDYITPAVIFDTEKEAKMFTRALKRRFSLHNEEVFAGQCIVVRVFTNN